MELLTKSIEISSTIKEESKEIKDLIESSNNYNDLIQAVEIEFLKVDEYLHIKSIFYTEKTLELSVAMNITGKLDYFFTISKNKQNLKYFTSIKGVIKYLNQTNQNEFSLRLNDGYKGNFKKFEVFEK